MTIRTLAIAGMAAALVAGCSGSDDATNNTAAAAEAPVRYTITPSISTAPDPSVRAKENAEIMDHMYQDPGVDPELIAGEAFRRGVPLDQAKLDAKRAAWKAQGGKAVVPQPASPTEPTGNQTATPTG